MLSFFIWVAALPVLLANVEHTVESTSRTPLPVPPKTMNCTIVADRFNFKSPCLQEAERGGPFAATTGPLRDIIRTSERDDDFRTIDKIYNDAWAQFQNILSTQVNEDCYKLTSMFMCSTILPTCGPSCTLLPKCDSICEVWEQKCGGEATLNDGIVKQINQLSDVNGKFNELAHELMTAAFNGDRNQKPKIHLALDEIFMLLKLEFNKIISQVTSTCKTNFKNKKRGCYDLSKRSAEEDLLQAEINTCGDDVIIDYIDDLSKNREIGETKQEPTVTAVHVAVYLIAVLFASFLRLLIRSHEVHAGSTKGRNRKSRMSRQSVGVRRVTYLPITTREKLGLAVCGGLSLLLGAVMFWFSARKERLVADKFEARSEYWWIYCHCFLGIVSSYFAILQFSSILRGVTFLMGRSERQSVNRNSSSGLLIGNNSVVFRVQKFYMDNFGLRRGKFFFQKTFIMELIEIIIQFIGFTEFLSTANLLYTTFALVVMLANVVVSPLLILLRHRCSRNYGKFMVYIVDSVLDLNYLFITLWRGGEPLKGRKTTWFVNLLTLFPVVSILMRVASIMQNILQKSQKEAQARQSNLVRHLSRQVSKKRHSSKVLQALTRGEALFETITSWLIILVGTALICWTSIRLAITYDKCSGELGVLLWQNAFPKKMTLGGFSGEFSCGYENILEIKVHGLPIASIPEDIGKCVNLERLELTGNGLTALPTGLLLLQSLKRVDLSGNPVESKLILNDRNVNNEDDEHSFPTAFICQHMRHSLIFLNASNCNIKKLTPCIGGFDKLEYLGLSHNEISSTGIPREILALDWKNSFALDVRGNPAERSIVWRGRRANGKQVNAEFSRCDTFENCDALLFLKKNFPAVSRLDLSVNDLSQGTVVVEILNKFENLKYLNLSYNKFQTMFRARVEADDEKNDYASKWGKLEVIDLRDNGISTFDSEFSDFIETRNHNLTTRLTGNQQRLVVYRYVPITKFPFTILRESRSEVVMFHIRPDDVMRMEKNFTLGFFCSFTTLRHLALSKMSLHDPIDHFPDCFGEYEFISILLRDTSVNASFPQFLWNVSEVYLSYADNKNFSFNSVGFPPKISTLEHVLSLAKIGSPGYIHPDYELWTPRMVDFSVRESNLFGSLPRWNMSNLRLFDVRRNNLNGTIPRKLLMNNNLKVFRVQANPFLHGTLPRIPPSRAVQMDCILAHGTNLSGSIPEVYFEDFAGVLTLPIDNYNISNLTVMNNGQLPVCKIQTYVNKERSALVCTYHKVKCEAVQTSIGTTYIDDDSPAVICWGERWKVCLKDNPHVNFTQQETEGERGKFPSEYRLQYFKIAD
jgi:hypothetical protein